MSPTISNYLAEQKARFEAAARKLFPKGHPETAVLEEAMAYSFQAGGKRIRPVLAMTVTAMLGHPMAAIIPAALAIEMVHAYSLIHDDLPAMDNDDFRRGKPTCHKAFGEAMAILAGDGLLTEAFHVAAAWPHDPDLDAGKLRFVRALADAAGIRGMVGGQVMDMAHPDGADADFLEQLHSRKTGAMIRLACLAPVHLFGAPEAVADRIARYGDRLGLLFQVTDDILDETASLETLGKTPGKDRAQQKLTYPALFGLDGTRDMADRLLAECLDSLNGLAHAERLADLARFVRDRSH